MPGKFSCETVRPIVEREASLRGGVNALACRIALRFGDDERRWERMLARVLNGQQLILTELSADRLALGLGLHPSMIWSDW